MRTTKSQHGHAPFQERRRILLATAAALAVLVFATDLLSSLRGAIAVLYVIVVLLVAQSCGRRAVVGAGVGCGLLTLLAFLAGHFGEPLDSAYVRLGVSLVAIAATTLLCVRDQTSRIRLEQASAQLVHAARISTLGQLTASIAHEVNQPLAAIINYAKSGKRWLSRDVPDVAEVANCLDHIVTSGSRAADVISRVRALARRGEQQVQALDLAKLAEESMALVYAEARAARVTMLFSRGDSVPPVRGDRVQIQQVIVNLLMNALQAMRDGESGFRELRIRVESGVPGTVRLAVGDTGPGIDGEIARIFEPFYTTRADGMGMGLSICRSIIEAQGGHIEAANNPDIGATVAFTLPAHTSV